MKIVGHLGSLVYEGYRLFLAPSELQIQRDVGIRLHQAFVKVDIASVLVTLNDRRTSMLIR